MDPEYFEQLAMPLFSPLYNMAHWLTGNRSDAEDLVQETYAKALKGFKSFQEGTNFRAWIYRILHNSFLTSRSGLAERNTIFLEDEQDAETWTSHTATPESLFLQLADQQAVHQALETLPPPHREIILLCDVEEMSYRETAEVLALPLGTVMSRLARARKALRSKLQQAAPVRPHNAV